MGLLRLQISDRISFMVYLRSCAHPHASEYPLRHVGECPGHTYTHHRPPHHTRHVSGLPTAHPGEPRRPA